MDRKNALLGLTIAAVAGAIFLMLLWQPARQVRLHQRHFLRAVEKRDWPRVLGFISATYRDRWGHDKENVVDEATQVFEQFLSCNFEAEERAFEVANGHGAIALRLRVGGIGSPVVELAKARLDSLTEPFLFRWEQTSWKPWDWALVEVDQPQLELGDRSF